MDAADTKIIGEITSLALQLPEEQKSQLLALISKWKKNARRAQREKYTELLNFSTKNGTHYGHAKDISATGVFIESKGKFKMGERVQLILAFISALNPVKLEGTVVRITAEGIGVRFDNHSQSQIKHLDSIISKHALIMHQGS